MAGEEAREEEAPVAWQPSRWQQGRRWLGGAAGRWPGGALAPPPSWEQWWTHSYVEYSTISRGRVAEITGRRLYGSLDS